MPPVDFIAEFLQRCTGRRGSAGRPPRTIARTVGHLEHVDPGLLMVAQVGDRCAVPRRPCSRRVVPTCGIRRDMTSTSSPIRNESSATPRKSTVPGKRRADRERRRAQTDAEHIAERAPVGLRRRVDVEVRPVAQERREEREALNVVPVQMGQQARAVKRLIRLGTSCRSSEARPEVEQQRVMTGDRRPNTRRIAPVARATSSPSHGVEPRTPWNVTSNSAPMMAVKIALDVGSEKIGDECHTPRGGGSAREEPYRCRVECQSLRSIRAPALACRRRWRRRSAARVRRRPPGCASSSRRK